MSEPLGEESPTTVERAPQIAPQVTQSYGPAPSVSASATEPPPASEKRPRVAGYEIVGELGRGGMGVVYKARQAGLNRVVALKMILAGSHAGVGQVARFRSEAEAVARLQHPNIVQIFEVGEWRPEEGSPPLPFFSLEFVDGGSLAQQFTGTPQPPRRAAELVQTLARAVQHAHEHGIVHRDLKPANVLIADCGLRIADSPAVPHQSAIHNPQSAIKITDFGLAKYVGDESGQTQSGAIVGTPSYMAPEQAAGAKEVGPAADIYALGAILYEGLTGRPPFHGATLLDTLEQVRTQEPVPPSRLQPKVPPDLETICLKCLRKETAKRYGSALDLAEDLRRFLAGEPIQARPVDNVERLWRWCRRNPVVATLLAALALVFTIGFGGVTAKWLEAEWEKRQKEFARQDATNQTAAAVEARGNAERSAKEASERADAEGKANDRNERDLYFHRVQLAHREWAANDVARARQLLADCTPREGRPDLRQWEWHYLDRLCHADLLTVRNVGGPSVAFSPDGKRLAVGGSKFIILLDAETARVTHTLFVGYRYVGTRHYGLAFSPDGTRLAAPVDSGVTVWDTTAEVPRAVPGSESKPGIREVYTLPGIREVYTLKGHTDLVVCVAFSPDGRRLVTGGIDRTIKVWDLATGRELLSWQAHTKPLLSVAFSADGRRLASAAGLAEPVKVWDAATGREVLALRGTAGRTAASLNSVAFSPDGRRLAVGGTAFDRNNARLGEVWMYEAATGRALRTLRGHTSSVWQVAFAPDGRRLASASADQTVKVWDLATGLELLTLRGHTAGVTGLAFSPDGARLASVARDVKVWDVTASQEALGLSGQGGNVFDLAFSGDSRRLTAAGEDGLVVTWDAATSRQVHDFRFFSATGGSPGGPASLSRRMALSPDGRLFAAVVSKDKGPYDLTVWETATGREVFATPPPPDFGCVAFSADGRRLAAGCSFHERAGEPVRVRVWDVASGKEVLAIPCERAFMVQVTAVAFSADGRRLAAAEKTTNKVDNTFVYAQKIKVWDAATGQELLSLPGGETAVSRLTFSPDGRRLASVNRAEQVGTYGHLRVWDLDAGREAFTLPGHTGQVTGVAFSPDSRRLASGGSDGTLKLWDASTGHEALTLRGHSSAVTAVAFSLDGKRLASATGDEKGLVASEVKIWDVGKRDPEAEVASHEARNPVWHWQEAEVASHEARKPVWHWQEAQDCEAAGEWFAAAWHLTALIEAQPPQAPPTSLWGHTDVVLAVAFAPDGQALATAGGDKTVVLWKPDGGGWQKRLTLEGHKNTVRAVAFSPDGKTLATGSFDKTVRLWDTATGKELRKLEGHQNLVHAVAFSPDGQTLASCAFDRTVRLWDVATGQELRQLRGHERDEIHGLAFSPDGRSLASAGYDRTVRLWDVATGKERAALQGHPADVFSVAFSPDGQTLASGSRDGTIKLWDAATGQPRDTLRKYDAWMLALAFSPDGKTLAAASSDRVVRLWDVTTRRVRATLHGHSAGVFSVAYAPDGQALATGSWDGTARVWDLAQVPDDTDDAGSAPWSFRLARGRAYGKVGQWQKAAPDYAHAVEWQPADPELCCEYAGVLALAGDADRYRQVCASALERFGKKADPRFCYLAARTCVLAPDAVPDSEQPVRLAEKAVAARPRDGGYLHTLGLAQYRAGRPDEAVKRLRESLEAEPGWPGQVLNWLALALAHHRLGQADEAKQWLDKTAQWQEKATQESPEPAATLGQLRTNWLEYQILRREAEALLRKAAGPKE